LIGERKRVKKEKSGRCATARERGGKEGQGFHLRKENEELRDSAGNRTRRRRPSLLTIAITE